VSAERALLAGDAVGIESRLAEGISVAVGTGMLAAHAAVDALESDCFDFDDFGHRIKKNQVGRLLNLNQQISEPFYEVARLEGGLAQWLGSGVNQ
jgi:flavin-dependent dehydrogenase